MGAVTRIIVIVLNCELDWESDCTSKVSTHHNNDKNISNESDDKNDGKCYWNKEEGEAPDHDLVLLVHGHAVVQREVLQGEEHLLTHPENS